MENWDFAYIDASVCSNDRSRKNHLHAAISVNFNVMNS